MFPEGKIREEIQGEVAGPGNTHCAPLCAGQPRPRHPWLVLLVNVERKHGETVREDMHCGTPSALPAVPSSTGRIGGFMFFCKVIRIMLERHPESFLTIYIIPAFSGH